LDENTRIFVQGFQLRNTRMVLTYLCPVTDMPKPMTYFRLAAYVYFRPRLYNA